MSKEKSPEIIYTFDQLLEQAGKTIKYSFNNGRKWYFARLWNHPFEDGGVIGINTFEEITKNDIHARGSLTQDQFELPGFVASHVTDKEIQGKRFSYPKIVEMLTLSYG